MSINFSKIITTSIRQQYEKDGIICLRQVIPQNWLDFLDQAIEEAMNNPGPYAEEYVSEGENGRFFGDLEMAERLPKFRKFVLESPAAEIIGLVMGAQKVNFFYDQLLVKEPGTSKKTPWHQDQPYWAVSGYQVASIWLSLDPVPKEVCVEYIKGSHRWSAYNPYHFMDGTPYKGTGLPDLPDIDANRNEYDIVSFNLMPGDCLVFHGMIVHGAPGNRGLNRRRALSTRWAGDDARYSIRAGEVAIPTQNPGLKNGDPLDSDRFPVVWRK